MTQALIIVGQFGVGFGSGMAILPALGLLLSTTRWRFSPNLMIVLGTGLLGGLSWIWLLRLALS